MKMANLFRNKKHVRRINCNWQGVKDCEVSEICVMVMFAKKKSCSGMYEMCATVLFICMLQSTIKGHIGLSLNLPTSGFLQN